jgi:16S rRNA processing protein RimM
LNASNPQKPEWIQIARILRARGNKGEVRAELLTDFPARLSGLKEVYLAKEQQEPKPIGVQHFWIEQNYPGHCVFHFSGSRNISDAEKFRGLNVLLPFKFRIPLPAGRYFVTDLIGCTVFQLPQSGRNVSLAAGDREIAPIVIGAVRDVFFPGEGLAGTPLLQVDAPEGELLIPLAEDICTSIDVAARRIEVDLPEGLRDQETPD